MQVAWCLSRLLWAGQARVGVDTAAVITTWAGGAAAVLGLSLLAIGCSSCGQPICCGGTDCFIWYRSLPASGKCSGVGWDPAGAVGGEGFRVCRVFWRGGAVSSGRGTHHLYGHPSNPNKKTAGLDLTVQQAMAFPRTAGRLKMALLVLLPCATILPAADTYELCGRSKD